MQKDKQALSHVIVLSDDCRNLNKVIAEAQIKFPDHSLRCCYDASDVYGLISTGDIEMKESLNIIVADSDPHHAKTDFNQLKNLKKRLPELNVTITAILPG